MQTDAASTPEDIDQHIDVAVLHASNRFAFRERLRKDPLFLIGCIIVALSLFLAAFGPVVSPYDPSAATPEISEPPPALSEWPALFLGTIRGTNETPPHWLGTDASGLDIYSRLIAAPRTDITIALAGALLSLALGTLIGLAAGFYRNWMTELVMRISDVLQAFPVFITAMLLVTLSGRSVVNIVIALALVYTPIFIRLTRAEVMSQSARGYVEAARAAGNRPLMIALKHILPNSMVPALVQTSVTIGFAIILTAGLSFVGAGVRPPTPEWGLMISQGASQLILGEWWSSVFPGIAMTITVFGYAAIARAFEEWFR
jgi:peptide/nickel transport system permease protein